jgi:hypothetical protein
VVTNTVHKLKMTLTEANTSTTPTEKSFQETPKEEHGHRHDHAAPHDLLGKSEMKRSQQTKRRC